MSPEKTAEADALGLKPLSQTTRFIDMVYLGEPGSGKTVAAAHMAKLGKVVWVCGEMGLEPGQLEKFGIPIDNVRIFDEITQPAIENLKNQLRTALRKDPNAYTGVVFDTFSEVQGKLLAAKAKAFAFTQPEYNTNTGEMTQMLRSFTDLPCHVVYVTHTKRIEDKKDEEIKYRAMMTPKVGAILDGYVRISCHMQTFARSDSEEADYVGYLRPHYKRAGKDRTGTLPPMLVNPTFDRILNYVDGRYLREAMNHVDESGEVPEGLDPEQFSYRERIRAQKAASEAAVTNQAATSATTPQEGQA